MRKFFVKLHLWLALPLGVFFTLICLTGSILLFEQEILELAYPERYFVANSEGEKRSLDEIVMRVNRELTNDSVTSLTVSQEVKRTYVASLASGRKTFAYINPYSGELIAKVNTLESFFGKVQRLHRWLLMSDRTTGQIIIGTTTLLSIIILITGLLISLPRKSGQLRSLFVIKRGVGTARLWYDIHRTLGMYSLLFLLIFSATGLMWSFSWYKGGVGKIFGVEETNSPQGEQSTRSREQHREGGRPNRSIVDWELMLSSAQLLDPSYQQIRLNSDAQVTILPASAIHQRATDSYRYSSREGLRLVSKYGSERTMNWLMGWAYIVHTGKWGGLIVKILSLLVVLIGASLPISGYVLAYRKYLKRR